ncbi:aminotransferase-like domain-containing protein [Deinococcus cellulosilyticus]|uniref:Transcriptional regulator n=1 Tax=Deinococcus cellulosilyticus (strain DSM 18568 / NBRC 106333 / KACC 11606 / 5516J-15) TaxID=1223518 RepID=A0A511N7E1_DEIC1|nr:PLP-dependent aminotransferase family protein [Deinococcus cellulosilyticus]GEM48750.1 transcriptional regulator [Deinococcus cellulosilyticus NBRC 106333 = KACC 11606]
MTPEASSRSSQRIYQELKQQIEDGLKAGDPLPSSRSLVEKHQASPNTVQKVISRLIQEGLVVSRTGRGVFVAERQSPVTQSSDFGWQSVLLGASPGLQQDFQTLYTPAPSGTIPLGSGYLDASLQPTGPLSAAIQRASRRPLIWDRVPPEGLEPLRNWFAHQLGVEAQNTLITSGAQTALSTIFGVLAHTEGIPVLVESPCHLGTLAILRACGMRPIPVPLDQEGIRLDLLEQVLSHSQARVLACQPTFQNPTGICWSEHRRKEVLALCKKYGVLIVEDGAAQDLWMDTPPPPHLVTLAPDQVIHVYSLTKPVAAGLRIAAIAAHGPLLQRIRTALVVGDLFVTGVMQEAALELVTGAPWNKHLKGIRGSLKDRRDLMLKLLRLNLSGWSIGAVPRGGFYIWARLPEHCDEDILVARALQQGVQINAGRPWFPAEQQGPHVRLSFAGVTLEQIQQGLAVLQQVSEWKNTP